MLEAQGKVQGLVAPFAGAWIEIHENITSSPSIVSLPSRERGLKYTNLACMK